MLTLGLSKGIILFQSALYSCCAILANPKARKLFFPGHLSKHGGSCPDLWNLNRLIGSVTLLQYGSHISMHVVCIQNKVRPFHINEEKLFLLEV
jgi:hypothetical protein